MKRIFGLLLLAVGFSGISGKAQVLNVKEVIQEQSEWCWTGVSASVLDYYGLSVPQCEIADYARRVITWHDFGDVDCCVDPGSGCNYWNYIWGSSGSVRDILSHFGDISTRTSRSALSIDEVASFVNSNRLFIFRWEWTNTSGHFLVGNGLTNSNLHYMDPWYGEGHKISDFDYVVSSSKHTWTHTLIVNEGAGGISLPQPAGNISGLTEVCQGESSIQYRVEPIAGSTSYQWILPEGVTGESTFNEIVVDFGLDSESGIISVSGINEQGEGDSAELEVNVKEKPATPVIILQGVVLESDALTGNQWYGNDEIIPGATEFQYSAEVDGEYYTVVTISGCSSDPSNTITVSYTSIESTEAGNFVRAIPNPFGDELVLEAEDSFESISFKIINISGQQIYQGLFQKRTTIPAGRLNPGIYFIHIERKGRAEVLKVIKK